MTAIDSTDIGLVLAGVAGILAPLGLFIQWLFGRKKTEKNEETSALAEGVTAISDASVGIASVVNTLIEPMQNRIDSLENEVRELKERDVAKDKLLVGQAAKINGLITRVLLLVQYIEALRRQISNEGIHPVDPPNELHLDDLSDLSGETEPNG